MMPPITPSFIVNESLNTVGLQGFQEFERWALDNDPQWHHADRMARVNGLSDEDRMKFIAYVMFIRLQERKDQELQKLHLGISQRAVIQL